MNSENSACFITFEGGDGAGKSTHIRFLKELLEERGYEVVCLREPGGTAIGESLRGIVLDPANSVLSSRAELLIYEAARAQIVDEVIKPALQRGCVVLCDRFYDSTVAYQGYGRGLDRGFITEANVFACDGIRPDRTIVMVPPDAEEGLQRATRKHGADRIEAEGMAFHTMVNDAFLRIAREDPVRMRVVRTQELRSDTARLVLAALDDLFPWLADVLSDGTSLQALDTCGGDSDC